MTEKFPLINTVSINFIICIQHIFIIIQLLKL